MPLGDIAHALGSEEISLGPYKAHAVFKGPVIVTDGSKMAVIYVPPSPYDFGKLAPETDARVAWVSPNRRVTFAMTDNVVTFSTTNRAPNGPTE